MKKSPITQENVHLLLPNKMARLADRLLETGHVSTMEDAIKRAYSSPVYARLEKESTKYWWQGINFLYEEMVSAEH